MLSAPNRAFAVVRNLVVWLEPVPVPGDHDFRARWLRLASERGAPVMVCEPWLSPVELDGAWRASIETPAQSVRRIVGRLPPNSNVEFTLVGDVLSLRCGEFYATLVTRETAKVETDMWTKGWRTRRWRKLAVTDLPLFAKRH